MRQTDWSQPGYVKNAGKKTSKKREVISSDNKIPASLNSSLAAMALALGLALSEFAQREFCGARAEVGTVGSEDDANRHSPAAKTTEGPAANDH